MNTDYQDIKGKYPGPEGQALGYPWKGMVYCKLKKVVPVSP